MIHHQDEPIADWVCVPLYYVAKLARDNGTIVVQVGEGSDELFHGYQGYIDDARFRRRYWEPFQRVPRPAAHGAPRRAVTALSRRHRPRRRCTPQFVADAAAGRQPFWGGAICWQGDIKDQRAGQRPRRTPTPTTIVERLLGRGGARAPGRRPAAEDDLPRAQAAAGGAAADARRQDDDGDFGRGARAVPRPRARRVRDGAAAER